jgi:hypothetical protein
MGLAYGHPPPGRFFDTMPVGTEEREEKGKERKKENPATAAIIGTRSECQTPPPVHRRPDLPSNPPPLPWQLLLADIRIPPPPTLSFQARSAASALAHRGSGGSASLPASHCLLRHGSPWHHR